MFDRKWRILSQTVFSLFYRFSMASSQSFRVRAFNYVHACFVGNRQLRVRSRDLTNILGTDKVQNEYRLKRQNRVNNHHLQTILTSKIFECLICKCIQFKETRFAASSRAENHVTLYNTSIRSNKSNVNSSSFTTETNLFLFCKRDFLKLYWGSSILTNPSLDVLEYGVQHWTLLFSSFLYLFLLFKFSSLDNIFEYIVSFQKKKFNFSPYLVGRRNEKMDVKVVFLGK